MSVVSVQSAEGTYPQLSSSILSDALHATVGELVTDKYRMLLVLVALLLCLVLVTRTQEEYHECQREKRLW